ncbi:MAG: hypothetical protein AAFV97_04035 [Bacteroidota bacterium]
MAKAFIRRHKADRRYWRMFTFMVGEVFSGRFETVAQRACSDNGDIKEILKLFQESGEGRIYFMGSSKNSSHSFLSLRLANEWLTTLPLSREEKIERFKQINQDMSITKSVHDWIDSECLSKNARYREEAINELVYALQHTKAIISIIPKKTMGPLIRALRNRDSSKRKFSMHILLSLCQESSFFTDKICEQLQKVLYDKKIASKDIRCDILTGLVEFCKKLPSSNSRVLLLLAEILESNSTIDTMSKDIVEKFRDELAAREELTITRELIDIYFETCNQAIVKYFIKPRFIRARASLVKEGKNKLVLRDGATSLIWEKPEEELDRFISYIARGRQSEISVSHSISQQIASEPCIPIFNLPFPATTH